MAADEVCVDAALTEAELAIFEAARDVDLRLGQHLTGDAVELLDVRALGRLHAAFIRYDRLAAVARGEGEGDVRTS